MTLSNILNLKPTVPVPLISATNGIGYSTSSHLIFSLFLTLYRHICIQSAHYGEIRRQKMHIYMHMNLLTSELQVSTTHLCRFQTLYFIHNRLT